MPKLDLFPENLEPFSVLFPHTVLGTGRANASPKDVAKHVYTLHYALTQANGNHGVRVAFQKKYGTGIVNRIDVSIYPTNGGDRKSERVQKWVETFGENIMNIFKTKPSAFSLPPMITLNGELTSQGTFDSLAEGVALLEGIHGSRPENRTRQGSDEKLTQVISAYNHTTDPKHAHYKDLRNMHIQAIKNYISDLPDDRQQNIFGRQQNIFGRLFNSPQKPDPSRHAPSARQAPSAHRAPSARQAQRQHPDKREPLPPLKHVGPILPLTRPVAPLGAATPFVRRQNILPPLVVRGGGFSKGGVAALLLALTAAASFAGTVRF